MTKEFNLKYIIKDIIINKKIKEKGGEDAFFVNNKYYLLY